MMLLNFTNLKNNFQSSPRVIYFLNINLSVELNQNIQHFLFFFYFGIFKYIYIFVHREFSKNNFKVLFEACNIQS